jgi:hypothetical protein
MGQGVPGRSIRILLLAGLFFLMGQIAVATLLDALPVTVRFPEAAPILMEARCGEMAPAVVFFGSSRFHAAIDPERLEALLAEGLGAPGPGVLNASVMAGEGHTIAFLQGMLPSVGQPGQTVVVEILPETVSPRVRSIEAALVRHFGWAEVFAAVPDLLRSGQLDAAIEARLNPTFRYRRELLEWVAGGMRTGADDCPDGTPGAPRAAAGVDPQRPQKAEPRRVRGELGKIEEHLADYRVGGGAQQALERAIARVHEAGGEILLVAPPLLEAHRDLYDAAIEQAFQGYVETLRERYHVRFLDWRAALSDDQMFDNHHANDAGRERFTEMLAEELVARPLPRPGREIAPNP